MFNLQYMLLIHLKNQNNLSFKSSCRQTIHQHHSDFNRLRERLILYLDIIRNKKYLVISRYQIFRLLRYLALFSFCLALYILGGKFNDFVNDIAASQELVFEDI